MSEEIIFCTIGVNYEKRGPSKGSACEQNDELGGSTCCPNRFADDYSSVRSEQQCAMAFPHAVRLDWHLLE